MLRPAGLLLPFRIPLNEIQLILATNPAPSEQPADPAPEISFADLGLSEVMLTSLAAASYHVPSPVQAGIIPSALKGIDVLGQARTGTGKTAAFAIPILERLGTTTEGPAAPGPGAGPHPRIGRPGPRRDQQAGPRPARSAAWPSTAASRSATRSTSSTVACDIVVGTPGRVIDHVGPQCLCGWRNCEVVVLDEADRMLDIGFRPDIEKILRRCPEERQTLLLSATVPAAASNGWPAATCATPRSIDFSPKDKSRRDHRAALLHGRPGTQVRICWSGCWSGRTPSRRSSSAAPSGARTDLHRKLVRKNPDVDRDPRRHAQRPATG